MREALEVAAVLRDGEERFRAQYGRLLSRGQQRVLRAVLRCRTAALGGHVQRCDDCGHQQDRRQFELEPVLVEERRGELRQREASAAGTVLDRTRAVPHERAERPDEQPAPDDTRNQQA